MSAFDKQEGGGHYKKLGDHQPWKVAKAWLTPEELKGAAKFTAIVYLCRENDKGGIEDIKKAAHTLQLYLELIEEQQPDAAPEPTTQYARAASPPAIYTAGCPRATSASWRG